MERVFQPLFRGGGGGEASFSVAGRFTAVDQVYLNSLLSLNRNKEHDGQEPQPPSLLHYHPYVSHHVLPPPASDSLALGVGYFTGDFTAAAHHQKLKMSKNELQLNALQLFNLNDGVIPAPPPSKYVENGIFHQLPNLLSLEHSQPQNNMLSFQLAEPDNNVVPVDLSDSVMKSTAQRSNQHRLGPYSRPPEKTASSSVQARQRRQRLGDKTRCLQKLLPWDTKMDTATMLEEAYKYIKFLEAQIRVLQSMPESTNTAGTDSYSTVTDESGGGSSALERLNRQQLLEVVVNSPVAQTVLSSKGCCIYSAEQLTLMQKKTLFHQVLFDSNSSMLS